MGRYVQLTLSLPEVLLWRLKSSSVRQSKITKGVVLTGLLEGNRRGIYPFLPSVVNMGAAAASKLGKVLTLSVILQISQNCPFVILLCLTPGDITVQYLFKGLASGPICSSVFLNPFYFILSNLLTKWEPLGWERVNSMGNEVYVLISIYNIEESLCIPKEQLWCPNWCDVKTTLPSK